MGILSICAPPSLPASSSCRRGQSIAAEESGACTGENENTQNKLVGEVSIQQQAAHQLFNPTLNSQLPYLKSSPGYSGLELSLSDSIQITSSLAAVAKFQPTNDHNGSIKSRRTPVRLLVPCRRFRSIGR